VLTDDKARAAYDAVMRAQIARKKRDSQMDSKRKKMKEELEERENRVKKHKVDEEQAKANLKHEIERLRKERMEILQKQAQAKSQGISESSIVLLTHSSFL
jgi:DnaJ family protein C protein 17